MHTCTDSCFTTRTAKKKVDWFSCQKPCNASCFSVNDNSVLKLIGSSSNVVFLCDKCSDKTIRMRGKNPRLSDISTGRSPASSIEKETKTQKSVKSDEPTQIKAPDFLTQIKPSLDLITEKLMKIENDLINSKTNANSVENNNETTTKTTDCLPDNDLSTKLIENITHLHAKIDSRLPSNFNKILSDHKAQITVKLDSLDQKLECCKPGNCPEKSVTPNVVSTPLTKQTKSNPLDWTMHFNQSSCIPQADSVDLYPLLAGFEKNTWASLDHWRGNVPPYKFTKCSWNA